MVNEAIVEYWNRYLELTADLFDQVAKQGQCIVQVRFLNSLENSCLPKCSCPLGGAVIRDCFSPV